MALLSYGDLPLTQKSACPALWLRPARPAFAFAIEGTLYAHDAQENYMPGPTGKPASPTSR
jgi:hypothetical protein